MPLTIAAGEGLASVHFTYGTDPEEMVCTLGVRALSPPLGTAHAERIYKAWLGSILLQQSSAIVLARVDLRVRQDGGGDTLFTFGPTAGNTGNLTFAGIAPNVAMLVRKHTTRAGRRGRGRMYVPGITEDRVDNAGIIDPTSRTAIQTELTDFRTLLADPGAGVGGMAVVPILFHGNTTDTQVTNPSPTTRVVTTTTGAAGPASDDIVSFQLDSKVATQRRRLR